MKKNILKSMSIIMSILLLMPFLESNCFFVLHKCIKL